MLVGRNDVNIHLDTAKAPELQHPGLSFALVGARWQLPQAGYQLFISIHLFAKYIKWLKGYSIFFYQNCVQLSHTQKRGSFKAYPFEWSSCSAFFFLSPQQPIKSPFRIYYTSNRNHFFIFIHPIEHIIVPYQQFSILVFQWPNRRIWRICVWECRDAVPGFNQFRS